MSGSEPGWVAPCLFCGFQQLSTLLKSFSVTINKTAKTAEEASAYIGSEARREGSAAGQWREWRRGGGSLFDEKSHVWGSLFTGQSYL